MDRENNFEGAQVATGATAQESSVPRNIPEMLLTSAESEALREIYNSLSRLLDRLSAIDRDSQERAAEAVEQSRCNAADDTRKFPEGVAMGGQILPPGIAASDLSQGVDAGYDNRGEPGMRYGSPLAEICSHLLRAQVQIGKLIHIGFPQTTSAHRALLSSGRQ